MNVELSGKTEKIEPYRFFGEGRVIDLMPGLVNAGYNPASIRTIIDRRMNAPVDVVEAWQLSYFWTGDSAGTDETGCAVLTLDSPILRGLHSESPLSNGALNLESKQWNALKNDKESLHLTSEQVDKAYGKGYIKKNGVWQPANSEVGKVWEGTDLFPGLARGRNLQNYAEMVSKKSGYEQVMNLYFDRTKPSTPNLRSLFVYRIDNLSNVIGYLLYYYRGRLAGVAPEAHVARENLGAIRVPRRKEVVDALYAHFESAPLADGITKKGLDQVLRKYL